ncbi:MAG TPA: HAD-IA family hydrolase [Candidatus Binataceae bacterium]|nr:HAD-IA family hydrolase [Candidatus Binataceae bacterium]
MLKVVFFDAAGTLFDARRAVGESYAAIAREFGVQASGREVSAAFRKVFAQAPPLSFGPHHSPARLRELERQWWHERVSETFAGLGQFSNFEAYFACLFAYFADYRNWMVHPGAFETLRALREQGLELGVVSNFDSRLYTILEGLGLAEYFHSMTISSATGAAKPDPEIFRAALALHQAAPDQAMHVGDSSALDIVGAKAAGLEAILFAPDAGHSAARLSRYRPDIQVRALPEVAEYVRRRDREIRFGGQTAS